MALPPNGLSCRWSEGHHHRHAAVNDIIHWALTAAYLPSRLEPTGLFRSDSKRPDGITLVPWRLLPAQTHLLPPTYQGPPVRQVQWQPLLSEASMRSTWTSINATSSHPWLSRWQVPLGQKPSRELGCCLKQANGETKSFSYLQQRLSVAVQRGNAATVMGCMGSTTSPFDFFP